MGGLPDDAKAAQNLEKHGIRFEVAAKVFLDPLRITIPDERFDYLEDRYITFGLIDDRLYVVVFAEDDETGTIRLISACKANAR
ncbi:MAG: BrnT family toxin [Stappiaceae bacterium]|uniref:BrnT family toxin n=1 Tax=Roseibium sp. TaxID=1936156 RepID=UPI003296CD76